MKNKYVKILNLLSWLFIIGFYMKYNDHIYYIVSVTILITIGIPIVIKYILCLCGKDSLKLCWIYFLPSGLLILLYTIFFTYPLFYLRLLNLERNNFPSLYKVNIFDLDFHYLWIPALFLTIFYPSGIEILSKWINRDLLYVLTIILVFLMILVINNVY